MKHRITIPMNLRKHLLVYHNPENSGFVRYLNHFKDDSRTAVCELKTNHRGWISSHADELE